MRAVPGQRSLEHDRSHWYPGHSAVRLYRSRAHREKADHAEAKGTLVPDAGKVRAAMDAVNSS